MRAQWQKARAEVECRNQMLAELGRDNSPFTRFVATCIVFTVDVIARLIDDIRVMVWHWSHRAVCAVKGHNYRQHMRELLGDLFARERPWCDRCGREQEPQR